MLKLLLLLPAFIWPFSVVAQNADRVVFRHLNKKDGLSQASVFASAQDSTGFLWFGTRDGLNRYDGFDFRVYRFDGTPSAPVGGDVRSLYVDPLTKELWVGTLSGLSRYDATTDAFSNYQHVASSERSLPGNVVRCVYRDRRKRLWVGTSRGLALLDEETNAFNRYYPDGMKVGGKGNDINFITEHPNGSLLLGTADGIYLLSENQQVSYQRIDEFDGLSLTCAVWDERGMLFVGTDKSGVIRWSPRIGVTGRLAYDEASENSLSDNSVRTLTFTSSGDLWVGTFHGLNLLKAGETKFTRYYGDQFDNGSLRDNSIRSLLVDDAGSLWVGTYYGGLHHLDGRYNHFTNYRYDPQANSMSAKVVSSFAQEPSGNLWVGTEGGGLNYFDEASGQFSRYGSPAGEPGAVTGNNVKELLLDGEQLWIGHFRAGLTRLNVVTGAYRRYRHDADTPETIAHDNVYGLRKKDNLLWILTYGGGLDILNTANGNIRNYRFDSQDSLSIDSDLTRSILQSATGEWWVGTESGLNRVTTDSEGYPVHFERLLDGLKVYALHEGQDGELWLGTFLNGLVRYDPKTGAQRRYTIVDGLPDNTVFGIIKADDGTLWLSTGNGLSRFDPTGESFINYDSSNGLDNLEYNFNAYFKAGDGAFLFGGINGFTRFYPQDMEENDYVPAVVFTGLWHNGREVSIGGEDGLLQQSVNETDRLIFGYNEARFTLGFAALDYFSPENNYYAYKLEGLDRDWTFATGVNEAAYTIQREGEYTFLLKAGNSDGVWSDQVRRITIVVRPPMWRSWWAYLAYLLLVGLLFYAVVFFLRLRHKVQLQEIAKWQQDELMETKLRFFTNITHEFRTPLTLILGPLHQLVRKNEHSPDTIRKLTMIERNAQHLLKLVNQVLTFRKLVADHEPMDLTRLAISPFLSDIFSSFQERARQRNITYTMMDDATSVEAWIDPAKLEKVFYNLLSNAFKFTPDGGTIEMRVEQRNDRLEISVTDSGIGVAPILKEEIFERFYKSSLGKQTPAPGSGIGLALSRQMVLLHHGRLYVEDNKAGSQGAKFVVELPFGSTHFSGTSLSSAAPSEGLSEKPDKEEDAQVVASMPHHAPNANVATNDKETLLVVEDNPDIREYLSDVFRQDFKVLAAESGLAGLKVAKEAMPSIIISDVMMPEMDGLAFCSAVKTDLNISHIPVILLTARTALPSRIKGLQTGADDYVTKPFNPAELRLRVTNLLANRKRFKESFASTLNLEPSRVEVTSIDEQFLRDALAVAERHVQSPDYKVDAFARDLAVSRTLLFNKIKALTGQTPSKFLKTFRLKRAAQLLTDSDYRIRKIANLVGFRDERYFSDCFKRQFGATPGAFRKKESKQ